MIETELNKVLNYMKQYVENVYEHDSEPMLNYEDLHLVLEEIERLTNKVEELMTLYTTERNVKEDYKTIIKERNKEINNMDIINHDLNKKIEDALIFINENMHCANKEKLLDILIGE